MIRHFSLPDTSYRHFADILSTSLLLSTLATSISDFGSLTLATDHQRTSMPTVTDGCDGRFGMMSPFDHCLLPFLSYPYFSFNLLLLPYQPFFSFRYPSFHSHMFPVAWHIFHMVSIRHRRIHLQYKIVGQNTCSSSVLLSYVFPLSILRVSYTPSHTTSLTTS